MKTIFAKRFENFSGAVPVAKDSKLTLKGFTGSVTIKVSG